MAENEEELKSLLMKVKEEGWKKTGLKLRIQETKIMASCSITSWNVDGKTMEKVTDFIFLGPQITADGDYGHEFKRHLLLWRQRFVYNKPSQHSKKQRHYFANKIPSSLSCGFSSGHVWMWELDHKESWVPKNWCFWTMVLEKTPKHPWTEWSPTGQS